jgi:pyruvate/2-oxoglutarate dehydrogenase complex dihydrolipoamide acyltransferase (E2) component
VRREYEDHQLRRGERQADAGDEPDVLLDVPVLKVEEIDLKVEGLRAHVAVLAELADLVKLSVGADVELDKVELTIKGVEAQALLKVRLEQVRAILDKALTTIGENPEILQSLGQTVDRTVGEVGGAAREAVGEGGTVSQFTEGVSEATQRVGDAAGQAVGQVGQTANQAAGQATDQVQGTAEQASEEAESHSGVVEDEEPDATHAARRKAEQLRVDLSEVEGSGSGGRIRVTDVVQAAQG